MASQHIKLTVRNQLKQIMTVSAPMHQIQLCELCRMMKN